MQEIINYIESLIEITRGKQREYYEFILESGTSYNKQLFYTRNEKRKIKNNSYVNFEIKVKESQRNSILAHYEKGFDYAEGFILCNNSIVLPHAFNINESGLIVDLTSEKYKFKTYGHWGVTIPEQFIIQSLNSTYLTPLNCFFYAKHGN